MSLLSPRPALALFLALVLFSLSLCGEVTNAVSSCPFARNSGTASTFQVAQMNDDDCCGIKMKGITSDIQADFDDDYTGYTSTTIGDVNGDSLDDVAISVKSTDTNHDRGSVFVVFGTSSSFLTPLDLSSLDGTNGFRIEGDAAHADIADQRQESITAIGDVNGDSIDDFGFSGDDAYDQDYHGGSMFLCYGRRTWKKLIRTGDPDAGIIRFTGGKALYEAGRHVSGAGDFNGDSVQDLLFTSSDEDYLPNPYAAGYIRRGKVFLVYGSTKFTRVNNVNEFDSTDGIVFTDKGHGLGEFSISTIGDFNGDGFDDIAITQARHDNQDYYEGKGRAFVVFGNNTFPDYYFDVSNNLTGHNGFIINGYINDYNYGSYIGESIAGAGDVDNDGYDDLIVLSYNAEVDAHMASQMNLIYGSDTDFAPSINLTDIDAPRGAHFIGPSNYDRLGGVVAGVGDLDGDSIQDFGFGDPSGDGSLSVVYGSTTRYANEVFLSDLDGLDGVQLVKREGFATSFNKAGDFNGDGIADIIISSIEERDGAGNVYVLFGGDGSPDTCTNSAPLPTATPTPLSTGDITCPFTKATSGEFDTKRLQYEEHCCGMQIDNDQSDYSVPLGIAEAGNNVVGVGDINGDLIDDLTVSPYSDYYSGHGGQVYVLYGSGDYHTDRKNLLDFALRGETQQGFIIQFSPLYPYTYLASTRQYGIASLGDVTGDGIDDILVGAPDYDYGSGGIYLIPGRAQSDWPEKFDLHSVGSAYSHLNITQFKGCGCGGGLDGEIVGKALDINGDALNDIIFTTDTGHDFAEIYVVFGQSNGFPADYDIGAMDASQGLRIGGFQHYTPYYLTSGAVNVRHFDIESIAGIGDFNGDQVTDLLIGESEDLYEYTAYQQDYGEKEGRAFVIYGNLTVANNDLYFNVTNLDGSNGFVINGFVAKHGSDVGRSTHIQYAAAIGDVDHDGFDDIAIGSQTSSDYTEYADATYLIYGQSDPVPASVFLSNITTAGSLDATEFVGGYMSRFDTMVAGVGDVDGDAVSDFALGQPEIDTVSVIFGKSGARWPDRVEVTSFDGTDGVNILGPEHTFFGFTINSAGDWNDDGINDMVIGSREADQFLNFNYYYDETYLYYAGGVTVLYGGIGELNCLPPTNSPTPPPTATPTPLPTATPTAAPPTPTTAPPVSPPSPSPPPPAPEPTAEPPSPLPPTPEPPTPEPTATPFICAEPSKPTGVSVTFQSCDGLKVKYTPAPESDFERIWGRVEGDKTWFKLKLKHTKGSPFKYPTRDLIADLGDTWPTAAYDTFNIEIKMKSVIKSLKENCGKLFSDGKTKTAEYDDECACPRPPMDVASTHDGDGIHISFTPVEEATCVKVQVREEGTQNWRTLDGCYKGSSPFEMAKFKLKKQFKGGEWPSGSYSTAQIEVRLKSKDKSDKASCGKPKSLGVKVISVKE